MKRGTIEQQERFSKLDIQKMYPNECENYDIVALMEMWHLYNSEPKRGDWIDGKIIEEVTNDGTAYFILLKK
jgi:hypothetical protein